MKDISVLGMFRSGTNVVRTILEWNYDCRVVYNVHGWKHGFFPIIAEQSKLKYQQIDFVHATKSPFSSIESLYRYYTTNGKNLTASREWKDFLRGRLIVYDSFQPHCPQYRFANPVDFWNSINWNLASVTLPTIRYIHVQYEDLLNSPEEVARRIAERLLLTAKPSATQFRMPMNRLRNMGDGPREKDEEYVTAVPFDRARYGIERAYLAQFDKDDALFVLNNLDMELVARLGYADEIAFVRDRHA